MQLTQDVNKEKHADLNIEPIILFNKEKSSLLPLPKQNIMNEYLENYKRIKVTSVNVKSFCSFLAKKYVGFWQRNLEGEIPSFKSLL